MAHDPNIEELIKKNPNVDADLLEEWRRYLRALRHGRTPGERYGLATPGARRRVQVGGNPARDTRTIHLGQRS